MTKIRRALWVGRILLAHVRHAGPLPGERCRSWWWEHTHSRIWKNEYRAKVDELISEGEALRVHLEEWK